MQVSSNPSSKWLDRLRRSKGFPAGADQDLDHFLSHQKTHFPNSPIQIPHIGTKQNPNSPELNRGPSSFLHELFNFGKSDDDPSLVRKKGIRKQEKPRFCEVSNRGDMVENEEIVLMREENGDVDEKGSCDFVGFSSTNVTVIDTSYPWWKCERVVFRKKNLWRFRDRKSKSANIGVNKRKAKTLENENDGSRKVSKLCRSLNEGNKQNEKTNKTPEDSPDTLNQVQNQRFPRKSKKGSADGVLIKKTLTSKKNGLAPLIIDGS